MSALLTEKSGFRFTHRVNVESKTLKKKNQEVRGDTDVKKRETKKNGTGMKSKRANISISPLYLLTH